MRPGGAEVYALELYEAMRRAKAFEPVLLAKGGPPMSSASPHLGTTLGIVNDDPNQYFFYNDGSQFDWLFGVSRQKEIYARYLPDFLAAYRPDVVHFQHTSFFGYDMICRVKNALPQAAIVYTLHEYAPICHRNGQMLRTFNQELCRESSPRRCHECFPDIPPQTFFMRKRFIQSHFSLVDLFLSPSKFLIERYVDWGIPRDRIRFEPNGRLPVRTAAERRDGELRNRFAFFGQINRFKGVDVLLGAVQILQDERKAERTANGPLRPSFNKSPSNAGSNGEAGRFDFHLWLHGSNLRLESGEFQNRVKALLEKTSRHVMLAGRYGQDSLPELMANIDWVVIPSIWWENSPLVIQEAFQHGRPVICSNVGGMAEKVSDDVNGLHFRVGDSIDLARTMRKAATTPGLWERLRGGIPDVYRMEDHVSSLCRIYQSLIEKRGLEKR